MPIRRYNVRVDPPSGGTDPNAPPIIRPRVLSKFKVAWTMSGDLSGILGYNVSLTRSGGFYNPVTESLAFQRVDGVSAREALFTDLPATDYQAWVQAYGEGSDSDWISSAGLTTVDDQIPTIRSGDDRNVIGFAEDFQSASLPTGFSFVNATYSLATQSELIATNVAPNATMSWDLKAWRDAYLPDLKANGTQQNGTLHAQIKLRVPTTANVTNVMSFGLTDTAGVEQIASFDVVNDGKYHVYRISLCAATFTNPAISPILKLYTNLPNAAVWHVEAIAVAYQNLDMDLDGNVDKGIKARNQFGQDPTGGGYFLTSPVRIPGSDGSYFLQDHNGTYFLRDESGNLVSESGYKLGRAGAIQGVASGAQLNLSGTDGNTAIAPYVPPPVSLDKFRSIVTPMNGHLLSAAPTAYPVRQWVELCNHQLLTSPSRLMADVFYVQFEGGSVGYHEVVGPWSQSTQSKSSLALETSESQTASNFDAWYKASDDGTPMGDNLKTYFRKTVWLKVVMPLVKKANGSYYWADSTIIIYSGQGVDDTPNARMNMSGSAYRLFAGKFRFLTDGRTRYVPIVIGQFYKAITGVAGAGLDPVWLHRHLGQDTLVHWWGQAAEDGVSLPASMEIYKISWNYTLNDALTASLAANNLKYVALEEF